MKVMIAGAVLIAFGLGMLAGWLMGQKAMDEQWRARLHRAARELRQQQGQEQE